MCRFITGRERCSSRCEPLRPICNRGRIIVRRIKLVACAYGMLVLCSVRSLAGNCFVPQDFTQACASCTSVGCGPCDESGFCPSGPNSSSTLCMQKIVFVSAPNGVNKMQIFVDCGENCVCGPQNGGSCSTTNPCRMTSCVPFGSIKVETVGTNCTWQA